MVVLSKPKKVGHFLAFDSFGFPAAHFQKLYQFESLVSISQYKILYFEIKNILKQPKSTKNDVTIYLLQIKIRHEN